MIRITLILTIFSCVTAFGQTTYLKYRIKDQKRASKTIGTVITSPLKTTENNTVRFENYKGKLIVVDFWYTKCSPCFREFPHMDSMQQLFKDEPELLFVNICSESGFEDWKNTIQEKQLKGMHLFDDNERVINTSLLGAPKPSGKGTVHDQLYLQAYPSYAFIDTSGKILGATTVGPSNKLLFAYYIDGILKGRNINETLDKFIAEIKAEKLSQEFLSFMKTRFKVNESKAYQMAEPYRNFF